MVNLIQSAKRQLALRVKAAAEAGFGQAFSQAAEELAIQIEVPKDRANGDFSTNFCMQAARSLKKAPRQIAEVILQNLRLEGTYFAKAEAAGPGFLNFYLNFDFYADTLVHIKKEGADYGSTDFGRGRRVLVEFVSANPTGPMHIGNARGGAIGDCLAACLTRAGFEVTREFYINDAGNQVEKFFQSLSARYTQLLLGEQAVPFPEDGYHGEDIKQRMAEFIALHGDQYLNAPEDQKRDALVGYALNKNVEGLKADLARYGIHYDVWFSESSLYESGEVEETLEILKSGSHTYEKEGALWFRATDFGCEKDEVLVRANGLCTYFAADIAYHRNKFLKRGYERCINVWGADHHGHVARMKGALNAVGLDGSRLDVVLMQLVRLVANGEVIKVSKRSGKAISLNDLLDEVGVDAARFFFNMRSADTHLEFDLQLAQEQSAQNPVYYVQYAHARISSILRLLTEDSSSLSADALDLSLLKEAEERELIGLLSDFPEEVRLAAVGYEPARITAYTLNLAAAFHKFYNAHRVNCEEENLRKCRVVLVECVQTVLQNALGILKVTAPERM